MNRNGLWRPPAGKSRLMWEAEMACDCGFSKTHSSVSRWLTLLLALHLILLRCAHGRWSMKRQQFFFEMCWKTECKWDWGHACGAHTHASVVIRFKPPSSLELSPYFAGAVRRTGWEYLSLLGACLMHFHFILGYGGYLGQWLISWLGREAGLFLMCTFDFHWKCYEVRRETK